MSNFPVKKRVKSREDFCAVFSFLADAIAPAHFEKPMLIYINGDAGSGKSLAADVMFAAFDDLNAMQGERHPHIAASHKFSREAGECMAEKHPPFFEMMSCGLVRQFMFRSAYNYSPYGYSIRDTKKIYTDQGGANGAIILTGDDEFRNVSNQVDLWIDVGDEFFQVSPERHITIIPRKQLKTCPRFQAYLTALILSDLSSAQPEPPVPNW